MQSKKIKSANPTPNSPITVSSDTNYKVMSNYKPGNYWPNGEEIIVKHKATKTFWKTVYRVYEDSSEADFSATWYQVFPKRKTIVEYSAKK